MSRTAPPDEHPRRTIARLAARTPGLALLVLHGSRARGDQHPASDWDLAFLADPAADPRFDADELRARLVLALGTDRVDLSPLHGTSGLFRYRVARDGVALFERTPGLFHRFWMEAVSFWCDAGPILRAGYEARLAEYRR